MRYLCFDVGQKRTGIALGSDEPRLASPVGVIECPLGERLVERMALAVEEHGPDAVVVGLPVNMDGTHGPQARLIAEFAQRLSERCGLPLHLHDERLTSFAADQQMARSGLTHKEKKARRDALAAAAILSDFLDAMGA